MKPYFDEITKQNERSLKPIPCGPALKCRQHSIISCNTCDNQSNHKME